MLKSAFTFIALFSIYYNCFTQVTVPEFGNVTAAELNLKECSFEKDAPAMFLFNTENVSFEANNYTSRIKIEHISRIKIFSKTGFKYATIVIKNAKSRYAKIDDIEAVVYNKDENGKMVSEVVSKDQMFREKTGSRKRSANLHFTFPNLKEGSVIEYRYTMIKKNSYNIQPWLFQDEIPTQLSTCSIKTSSDVKLEYKFVTPHQTDSANDVIDSTAKTKNSVIKTFIFQHIPSFKIEPYMSSVVDNIDRVEFILRPTFSFMDNLKMMSSMLYLSPHFGNQITKEVNGTAAFLDSAKALHNNEEKISAVYEFVTKNIRWNNEQLFLAEDIENAIQNKSGSSAEINLLIVNLLKKLDIECDPVLISTKDNGKVDMNFPSMGQFNGVDVLIVLDSSYYVVDGTQEYQSYKIPPINILNRNALSMDSKLGWITISDNRKLMNSSSYVQTTLDSNGILRGNVATTLTDYAKAEQLKKANEDKDDKDDDDKDFLQYNGESIVVDTSYADSSLTASDPLVMHMNFHYALTNNDDYYFLNPFFFSLFRKNPFTDNSRNSDIDFGCNQHFLTYLIINVPDNFNVEELPKSKILRTSDSSIFLRTDVGFDNGQIQIRYDFQLSNPLFAKEDYPAIKQYFEKIYAVINQQVLLKKKS